jgi:acetyl esterase/lipase
MMRSNIGGLARLLCGLALTISTEGLSQTRSSATWAAEFYNHYRTIPDLTYRTVAGRELKLDVYQRSDLTGPAPTLFFVHGGGWVHQSKADVLGNILPWLEMGWTVVNVDYRIASQARAPAAAEDCRCALRWVAQHAKEYQFDLDRLVISGASAGAGLALLTAMAPDSAGLDGDGSPGPLPRPSAIVSLSGITDVAELMDTPNGVAWLPPGPERAEIARRVSPITYVRAGLPPILSIHGAADQFVPYQSAVRFHAALTKAGVPNQLFSIPGGQHGGYSAGTNVRIYEVIRAFLAEQHLAAPETP